jgi:hypothetical protein
MAQGHISLSVMVRREPPFGVSALSVLSLLTRAQKYYAGLVNICHSPTSISPRVTLDDDKQSLDVSSGVFVCSKGDHRFQNVVAGVPPTPL